MMLELVVDVRRLLRWDYEKCILCIGDTQCNRFQIDRINTQQTELELGYLHRNPNSRTSSSPLENLVGKGNRKQGKIHFRLWKNVLALPPRTVHVCWQTSVEILLLGDSEKGCWFTAFILLHLIIIFDHHSHHHSFSLTTVVLNNICTHTRLVIF